MGIHAPLLLAAGLFSVGIGGFVARRNVFALLMCIELMLNAVNLVFVTFSRQWLNLEGQVTVLLVVALAAAEAAVALAIVIMLFRNRETLDADVFGAMKE